MIGFAATAFIILVIVLNLIALALVGTRYTQHYSLSRVATPVVAALTLFFCEHFVGLGRLSWCWPFTTMASVWIILGQRQELRRQWRTEAAFMAAFSWVFAWRFWGNAALTHPARGNRNDGQGWIPSPSG